MTSSVVELKEANGGLPEAEDTELRRWLLDHDWERWDRQFEEDVLTGKLDFLKAEVLVARANGELRDL